MPFRVLFNYTQPDKSWAEVWYLAVDTLSQARSLVNTQVFTDFMSFRHELTVLKSYRISDVANNRVSYNKAVNRAGARTDGGPDVSSTAALVSFNELAYGTNKKVWLRGLVDDDVRRASASGADVLTAALGSGIDRYIRRCARNGYCIQSQEKIANPPVGRVTWTNILRIDAVKGSGQVRIATTAPAAYVVGDLVKIARTSAKDFPGLNGIWKVIAVENAGAAFWVNWNPAYAFAADGQWGRCRPITYRYGAVDEDTSDFYGFNSRKTGKNRFGGRGARSAVHLRHAP